MISKSSCSGCLELKVRGDIVGVPHIVMGVRKEPLVE